MFAMPPTLTVDRNVIISVLNLETGYEFASRIFVAHTKSVLIAASAANRVENSKSGEPIQPLDEFLEDCRKAGLIDPEILDYPLDWEMGLWEHGFISPEGFDLELAIHKALFPHVATDLSDDQFAKKRKKVTNAKCDVFAMWGHIFFKRDYFITNDDRFSKRRKQLEGLGAKGIYTPRQFVEAGIACL